MLIMLLRGSVVTRMKLPAEKVISATFSLTDRHLSKVLFHRRIAVNTLYRKELNIRQKPMPDMRILRFSASRITLGGQITRPMILWVHFVRSKWNARGVKEMALSKTARGLFLEKLNPKKSPKDWRVITAPGTAPSSLEAP